MAENLPRLPVGVQVFETLRHRNAVYVDKTGYFPGLESQGQVVFCARPRRFGKTLTVTALDAFYSGKKDLFRGLAAEEHLHSPAFTPRPVINLDMSAAGDCATIDILNENIMNALGYNALRNNVALKGSNATGAFFSLINDVGLSTGRKAVILIDEYDAPVLNLVQRGKAARDERLIDQTRSLMRGFYAQIKAAEAHIDFTFITGVSKFSRMGVFSSLNNVTDISLEEKYGTFMGYTQEELEANFAPHIEDMAKRMGIGEDVLLRQMMRAHLTLPSTVLTHLNVLSCKALSPVVRNGW
ncbi:MAG: AAA family ATPase [Desulfovibrio sp.]|jgi:hypothetical protein|nr:AAA family ATPase [Desulfovibrio sp.]